MDSETLWRQFGEWYRERRRDANLTQEQAATNAGITRQHLGSIEKGESGVKRDTVIALAKCIGTDVNEALDRAGMKTPPDIRAELDAILQNAANTTGIRFTELKGDYAVQYESDQPPAIVEITEELRRQGEVLTSNAEKLDMVLDYIKAQKEKSQPNSEE